MMVSSSEGSPASRPFDYVTKPFKNDEVRLINHSPRKTKPLVTVNSGSLPPDLLESNLFGHVKGAFTGAVSPKKRAVRDRRRREQLADHLERDDQAVQHQPGEERAHVPTVSVS